MNEITDYDEKLQGYAVKIEAALDMYCDIIDEQETLQREIIGYRLDYLAEFPETKSAMEKVDALACVKLQSRRTQYKDYDSKRLLGDKLKFRIEVLRDLHGGVRSQMKNNPPIHTETWRPK